MADVDFDFFDEPAEGNAEKKRFNFSSENNDEHHHNKHKIETKVPKVRDTYSSDESESESPRSGRREPSPKRTVQIAMDDSDDSSDSDQYPSARNNAWSEQSKNGRPKSAHPSGRARSRNQKTKSKSPSRSRSRSKSRSKSRSRSRSGSESGGSSDYSTSSCSDSDITDVSPLASPINSARSTGKKGKVVRSTTPKYGSKPPASPSWKSDSPRSTTRSRPTSAKINKLLRPDKDSMDLKLLMQAVLEMEQERERAEQEEMLIRNPKQPRFYVPQAGSHKKNYSFRNNQSRDIDRENTRLMQEIIRHAAEAKKKRQMMKTMPQSRTQPVAAKPLVTSSAVNRRRDQERIDRENRALLKRLEGAKATTTLRKDKLHNEFNNHRLFGVPMGTVHPLEKKKRTFRSPSPYDDTMSHTMTRSRTNMSDTSSVMSTNTTSSNRPIRPQSAKVTSNQRPLSGKKTRPTSAKTVMSALSSRPEWESGW